MRWKVGLKSAAKQVRKRHFLSHLYIKINILPRQARDKHRENSKKDAVFRTSLLRGTFQPNLPAHRRRRA
jgi:hypothetical protein